MRPQVFVALLFAGSGMARAAVASDLAIPLMSREPRPTLILAQRTIERSWGPSDDSVYVEHDIPEWRSEGGALALSAVVPGLGQAYAGEGRRGRWFALAEAAGWVARQLYLNRGHELRDQAAAYAGAPTDSASAWSFARFESATPAGDPELRALYAADAEAFYDRIAADPRYSSGWGGDPETHRLYLAALRDVSNDRLRFARYASMGLWINHLTAAVDALRAARTHNVPLTSHLGIKVKSGWRRGGPALTAALEGRF